MRGLLREELQASRLLPALLDLHVNIVPRLGGPQNVGITDKVIGGRW